MVGRTQVAQRKMYQMGSGPMANAYFMFERLRKFVYSSISFAAFSAKASNPVSWATRHQKKNTAIHKLFPQYWHSTFRSLGFMKVNHNAMWLQLVKKVYHTILVCILCMTQLMATLWIPHTNSISQITLTASTWFWSFRRRSHMEFFCVRRCPPMTFLRSGALSKGMDRLLEMGTGRSKPGDEVIL